MILVGLFQLVLGLTGQWLLGLAIARWILGSSDVLLPAKQGNSETSDPYPRFVEAAGLGIVLGLGLTAYSLFLWSLFGGKLGAIASGVHSLSGWIAGGPWIVSHFRCQFAAQSKKTFSHDRYERAVCCACQFLISILFVTTFLQTLQTPQKLWDERAIFALKARVLFEDRTIHSPALLHPDFVQYHPRYPLLLPLAEQNILSLYGSDDDRLSKLIFPLLYCGMVLTATGVLLRHLTPAQAWFAGLLLATIPVLVPYEYGFLCGQADAPIACYHSLSLLFLWDALRQKQFQQVSTGSLVLAGIFAGLAAFTKDEGIAYLIIDGTILGLLALSPVRSRQRLKRSCLEGILFLTAAGIILVPWLIHRRSLPNTTEMNYFERMTWELFFSRMETLRWSVPHLVHRMFWEWNEWGLQWWLMLAALVSRPRSLFHAPQLLLVLDVTAAIAALLVAGMLAPAQLNEHIGGSSHRFLMQIAPIAVLFAITTVSIDIPKDPRENS